MMIPCPGAGVLARNDEFPPGPMLSRRAFGFFEEVIFCNSTLIVDVDDVHQMEYHCHGDT